MKPCQLCGACSWGPMKEFPVVEGVQAHPSFIQALAPWTYLTGKDWSVFRCCDACGALAALALIDESSQKLSEPYRAAMPLSPPGPFDQAMLQVHHVLAASMPIPETRTERLVRALLVSPVPVVEKFSAQQMVELIRDIEAELDRPQLPVDVPGLVKPPDVSLYRFQLQFVDRMALETWVAAGLHDTDCPTHLEKALAYQFADWVEERAP